jgi:hypothetical protein
VVVVVVYFVRSEAAGQLVFNKRSTKMAAVSLNVSSKFVTACAAKEVS